MLLRIYPMEYRGWFADEMRTAFEEGIAERSGEGRVALLGFVFGELASLISGAAAEWAARFVYALYHSNRYIGSSCLPNPNRICVPGVSRELYAAAHRGRPGTLRAIDDSGWCANAHQTFVLASPLRRLAISICSSVLPIHPAPARRGHPAEYDRLRHDPKKVSGS
jgi:hypothetical protein